MYTAEIDIFLDFEGDVALSNPIKKSVERETREELEDRLEEIARVISTHGFFDDEEPNKWVYLPTHSIKYVQFTLIDPQIQEEGNDG